METDRTALTNPIMIAYDERERRRRLPFGDDVPCGLGAYPPFGLDSKPLIGSANTLRLYRKGKSK